MAANFLQQFPRLPNLGKLDLPGKLSGLYRPRKAVPEHQAMVQRQASMSLVAPHGLQNLTGENNCFLNSAIQVLWHIDVFRRSFRALEGHTCVGKSCIFCALKDLFTQFQHSSQTTIPPDVLRHALAECYREKHRFQLNLMDDAAECFEKLLEQVHYHLTGNDDLDSCGAPYCISHQCFALNILERTECVCGATSEPLSFVQFIHYISSSALVKEAQKYLGPTEVQREDATPTPGDTPTNAESRMLDKDSSVFGKILHAASSYGEYRQCPNFAHCKKNVDVKRILLNCPDIVCLGLIWDSDQPPVDDIMAVVNNIGLTLQLNDVFDTVSSESALCNQYQLTAAIAYYGRHYSTFCLHSRKKEWIYFDDANFRTIGAEWTDVCEEIRKAHYQPLLLVYSNPFAETINVSQAPKEVSRVYQRNKKVVLSEETASNVEDGKDSTIPVAERQNGDTLKDEARESSKPPADVINPMTLSIVPGRAADPEAEDTPTGGSDATPLAQVRDDVEAKKECVAHDTQSESTGKAHSQVTSEPMGDLMTFSVTPASIARMTQTAAPAHRGNPHYLPATNPKSEQASEEMAVGDLIEFSISPNLLGNVHNSNIEFRYGNSQQHRIHPQSSPNLRTAAHQSSSEKVKADQGSSKVASFQRQSSFPFLSKQPASNDGKREVHAVPLTSDFANHFQDYKAREGDLLKPNWDHFAESERGVHNSRRARSASPEGWTVLNTAGDEEGTFITKRQPIQGSEIQAGETKSTPAITSLRKVASRESELVKSDQPMSSRPLPSVPYNYHTDPSTTANRSRGITSPTACVNSEGDRARFTTQHHPRSNQSHQVSSGVAGSGSTSKISDPVYIDPNDLVFTKPGQQISAAQGDGAVPSNSTQLSKDSESNNVKDDHYIELEFEQRPSDAVSSKVVPGGGGGADGGSKDFYSPPITDDPLYAIPEKLKVKLEASHLADGQDESPSDSAKSLSSTSISHSGGEKSSQSKPSSGADYLTLLLQERQKSRQTTSPSATTPTENLLEATTKFTSHIDMSAQSSVADPQTSSKHKPITGKEYLQELMQKRQESKSMPSNVVPVAAPVNSPSQPIGSDPLYAVPVKPKLRTESTHKETKDVSTPPKLSQSTDTSSIPIGRDPLYAVPDKTHRKTRPTHPGSTDMPKSIAQPGQGATYAMPQIPDLVHARLLEARDLWAKAEASQDTDKTVSFMLFSQHNGIISQVLRDPSVRSNTPLLRYVTNIKEEGTRRAAALKSSITPTTSRSARGTCKRCGNSRNLDTNNLCGPCRLRVQIGQ